METTKTTNMVQKAVRLPVDLQNRLDELAKKTGRTAAYYMREAIAAHLDDLEDYYDSEKAISEIRDGKAKVLNHDEFWKEIDNVSD